ncbi:MAG: TolC family protein [Comamonadaceae bacterium]|nr:TolC family protein [Comamonadaceae bacterium]
MKTPSHTGIASVLLSTIALALAACSGTRVDLRSQVALPQAFEQAPPAAAASREAALDISRWWQQWHDPVLSQLIEQGLQHGHDVRIARSRLQEARAHSRLATADQGPVVGANARLAHLEGRIGNPLSESSRAALQHLPAAAGLGQDSFKLQGSGLTGGLTASWEPDFFGHKRSDADAARHAALGVQEQLHGAQLLLAASMAEHYFQARAAQSRLHSAQRHIAALQRLLQYVQGRFQAGQINAYPVQQVRTQLAAAQARHSAIGAEYAAQVRSIAVLAGQTPQGFRLPDSGVDVLAVQAAAPAGQTPQGLLERRPDLRAHAAQVQAHAAKLASAQADLLPRFSIEFLGQGRIGVDSATDLKGWGSLLSLGLQVPLFTNGRIQANIAAADARLQTALLQYDQALLRALGEVDSAYQAHSALLQQNARLASAHRQALQQVRVAEQLFRHGQHTLDEALRARLNEADLHSQLTQSRLAQAQAAVALYKALGGGWSAE